MNRVIVVITNGHVGAGSPRPKSDIAGAETRAPTAGAAGAETAPLPLRCVSLGNVVDLREA